MPFSTVAAWHMSLSENRVFPRYTFGGLYYIGYPSFTRFSFPEHGAK